MIDELRMPTARHLLSGRQAAEDRGSGGFDVALGGALEPPPSRETASGLDTPGRRGPPAAPARPEPAADGHAAERMLRARRQAERQGRGEARTETRPASQADAGRPARTPGADQASEASSPQDAQRRLSPDANEPSGAQTDLATDGDAIGAEAADQGTVDHPSGKADATHLASTPTDAASVLMNPAVTVPRPGSPSRSAGGAMAGQAGLGEADALAMAGGSARHLAGPATSIAHTDPAVVASAPAQNTPSRQTPPGTPDPAALAAGAGGPARQAGAATAASAMMTAGEARPGETRPGDSLPASGPAGGPRRDSAIHPLGALYAARIDWRPGGGATASQNGEQGSSGSGDMGSPARLLAALEEMRQSGGSASSQGAAAFAAALSSSQVIAGPASGATEAPPVRLSNPWPVDHPAFPAHLAEQVGDSLLAGLDRAEITVTPPEMGPIRIELSLNGEQASVAFSATQPDTRTAIEQSLPLLRSMLSEQGLQLADSSVGSGYRPPAEAGAQPSAGDGGGAGGNDHPSGRPGGTDALPIAGTGSSGRAAAGSRGNGLLDLFA